MKQVPAKTVQDSQLTHNATEAQHGLYYLCGLNPSNPAYNVSCCYEFYGPINLTALDKSLDAIVSRHDALRTSFSPSPDGLIAYTTAYKSKECKASNSSLRHIQLARLPEVLNSTAEDSFLNEFINRPFKLDSDATLFRCALYSSADGNNHRFVFVAHHLVFDFSSKSVFQNELSYFYSQLIHQSNERAQSIPAVDYQLRHYAQYKADQLSASKYDRQLAHWQKKLSNFSPAHIPIDYPRSSSQDVTGLRVKRRISDSQIELMRQLTAANQTTLFMGMLTVGQLLISRWSGESDTSVGTHMLDRREPNSNKAIGFFLNTLVLRSNFAECTDFVGALKTVRKTCFDAFRFSQVSFERLVESLGSERDPSRTPFFDVRFSHLSAHEYDLELPGVDVRPIEPTHCRARYDLTLTFHESEDVCSLEIEYRTSLFNQSTIDWLMDKYIWLLEEVTKNPAMQISDMALIQGDESISLLRKLNPAPSAYPTRSTIDELVSKQAKKTPEHVAIVSDGRSLTYGQLEENATKLSAMLIRNGVPRGSVVGICMERNESMMITLLAILKIGASYLPLDKHFPSARLSYMLTDSQCEVVLIDGSTAGVIKSDNIVEIRIDKLLNEPSQKTEEPSNIYEYDSSNLAYLIYTSGSTGNPKGVRVTHSNVVNFLCSMQKTPGISAEDKLVAVTTLSFDIAVLELWLPLISGACVVIASKEITSQGDQLAELLNSTGATMMQATPITWRLLLGAGWTGNKKFTALCGGETLPPDLGQMLASQCKALWNMYGPTETTVWSCCKKIDPNDQQMLIGYPINNTQFYVLDRFDDLAYPGTAGHLHIGGAGVSSGYHGKQTLTREKFKNNPFMENQIIYATGDSVRYLPDGNLKYINRIDNQIKLRGYRIELGEIEAQLSSHNLVKQAVATVLQRDRGDPELLAYVELEANQTDLVASLRSSLRKKLPNYMVPQRILVVESLPLTPNGKIDRNALPAPLPVSKITMPTATAAHPKTQMEKQLAGIWADVLGVNTVPVNETLFDLGGHSLLAMIVIARAEKEMGFRIDPLAMIDSPIRKILTGHDPETDQVRSIDEAVGKPQIETGFFDNDRLYARLYRPNSSSTIHGAVLLCNPLFSEANHLHLAYRQLANRLAKEGYVVLRFDYYGCGNSMGEDEEGTVEEWINNIRSAARYLKNQSGVEQINVVAFRFGAALASLSSGFDIDKFLLWEPIFRGADQLKLLDRKYQNVIDSLNKFRPERTETNTQEIVGFPFTTVLRKELACAEFFYDGLVANSKQVSIYTQNEGHGFQSDINTLQQYHSRVNLIYVQDSAPSIDAIDEQAAWLPGKAIGRIVSLITES